MFTYIYNIGAGSTLNLGGTVVVRQPVSGCRGGVLGKCTALEKVRMAARLQEANALLPFVTWQHYKVCTFYLLSLAVFLFLAAGS